MSLFWVTILVCNHRRSYLLHWAFSLLKTADLLSLLSTLYTNLKRKQALRAGVLWVSLPAPTFNSHNSPYCFRVCNTNHLKFTQWFSNWGPNQKPQYHVTWDFIRNANFHPAPDLQGQKFCRWGPASCVLTSQKFCRWGVLMHSFLRISPL